MMQADVLTIYPDGYLPPGPALVANIVTLGGALALFLFTLALHRRARSAKRRADDREERAKSATLAAGPALLHGEVELAEGSELAVRLAITQWGHDSSKVTQDALTRQPVETWSHAWLEHERETIAEPFYLRIGSGERVRVEPGASPRLVDGLDETEWLGPGRRVRIANLQAGEGVFAEGVLARARDPEADVQGAGYRTAAREGWVLRPGRAPMLLSTKGLGERHQTDANRHVISIVMATFALGFAAIAVVPWNELRSAEDLQAQVVERDTWTTSDGEGHTQTHYRVRVEVDDERAEGTYAMGRVIAEEVDAADYGRVHEGDHVWVRWLASHPTKSRIARGPVQSTIAFGIIFLGLLSVVARHVYVWRTPVWYDRKLHERGVGPLPKPPPEVAA